MKFFSLAHEHEGLERRSSCSLSSVRGIDYGVNGRYGLRTEISQISSFKREMCLGATGFGVLPFLLLLV